MGVLTVVAQIFDETMLIHHNESHTHITITVKQSRRKQRVLEYLHKWSVEKVSWTFQFRMHKDVSLLVSG